MKPRQQSYFISLVILAVFALVGWNIVLASPQYSVYQMYQAVKKHDYEKFQMYVDVDSVSADLATRTVAKTNEYIPQRSGILLVQLGMNFAKNLIKDLQPTLKQGFEDAIQKEVETGTLSTTLPKISNLYQAITQVKAEPDGDIDNVTITDKSKMLHVTMKQVDKHWQITKMDLDPKDLPSQQK